jgi:NAD(P)-dependent dehydrogenase (short-subunit alcohol dehydrogenase family)
VLARRGATVFAFGRTASSLESLVREIRTEGGIIEMQSGDVGDRASVARAVEKAITCFGRVDVLVNNAQTHEYGVCINDITDERIEIPFRSGTLGTLYCMQACHPHMKRQGGGAIVNFGSGTSLAGC